MAFGANNQAILAEKSGTLLVRIGLVILMIVVPVAAIYSRQLIFALMPVGAALVLVGALLMPGHRLLGKTRRAIVSPALVAGICFLAWAGMTLAWTPVFALAGERYLKTFATLVLAFIVITYLPSRSRTSNLNLLPIGVGATAIATVALTFLALQTGIKLEAVTLERAALGLVLLVWPALAALMLREKWMLAGILAVAVGVATSTVWTPAAMAGIAFGALVASLASSRPRWLAIILGSFLAILFLIAPAIPLIFDNVAPVPGVPLPVSKSLLIWAEIIRSDPWRLVAAFGLDTLPRGLASGFLPIDTPRTILFEIWFEYGVLGAICSAAIIFTTFVGAGRAPPLVAPFMLAGFTCAIVIAIWGVATFQLWWMTMVAVMAIGFGGSAKGRIRRRRPNAPPASGPLVEPAPPGRPAPHHPQPGQPGLDHHENR